jgi:ribosome-binding protein aMBF1 (putative translation factor)
MQSHEDRSRRLPPPRRHVANPNRPGPDRRLVEVGLDVIGRMVLDGRRRANLSQGQLERMSGVDQTTISRLERGRLPGISLSRLAAILGTLALALGGRDVLFVLDSARR